MTLRSFIRPSVPLARRVAIVAAAAGLFGLGACNESVVPNYNYPSALSLSTQGLNAAVLGAFNARTDAGNWAVWTSGFGREATYFTLSEQRFVTELTGLSTPQSTDFIGETVWDNEFGLVKTADSAQTIVNTLLGSGVFTDTSAAAAWGVLETAKAMDYMLPAMSRDSLGTPINAVGQVSPPFAPILCNQSAWAEIVAMFDSAADSLNFASAEGSLPVTLPAGFEQVNASPATFMSLVLALRAKARIQYAYAIQRQSGLSGLTPVSGTAAIAQLDSANSDIQSSSLYSASLSSTEAIPANDAGVFFDYSTQGNDVINPIFSFVKGYYALLPYVTGIGADTLAAPGTKANAPVDTTDVRWTAKFIDQFPFVPGAAYNVLSSSWNYANNLSASSPLPIIRNLELQFMLARTEFGLDSLVQAVATINKVRTEVGGVSALAVSTTSDSAVAAFIVNEARLSFIGEGTGEDIIAMRDYGNESTFQITFSQPGTAWFSLGTGTDAQTTTLPIPIEESSPRGGDITPVCTGSASVPTSKPAAKSTPKARGPIIRLH
jgi:hypothetical protein